MNALRRAWETERGRGSVVGLAPSAVAAQVLADDLGIEAENTAKWWDTHVRTGATFRRGQLVIVDEAWVWCRNR
ncbi:AAA family ATPase [Microbacterium betulae]|uniref:AAA family ATPase n=1 Tax=Microbacterium betulae TaxID=2981139 RepID=A0AA97I3V6_9MICO|nr:AAA family ATPase [Microbacterium sp. AB]WOF21901.1 AAA family ATPase [Microbacterium sp. AB]